MAWVSGCAVLLPFHKLLFNPRSGEWDAASVFYYNVAKFSCDPPATFPWWALNVLRLIGFPQWALVAGQWAGGPVTH